MTIAHCPKCREQVTLPSGVSRQARVRCPLCSEEYLLDEALKPLPPLLLVLEDPGASAASSSPIASSGMAFVPAPPVSPDFAGLEADMTPALMLDEPEPMALAPSPAAAPAFQFESGSATGARRPLKTSARGRSQRKSAGPLRLMIQTIGGGAMGLVIAQLILWWMPGNWQRHNRDPFGLSAKVIPYAPFLVPASLKGEGPVAQAETTPTIPDASPRGDTSQLPGESATDATPANSQIPDFTFDPNATETKSKKAASKNKGKGEPAPAQDAPAAAPTEPSDEPVVVPPKVESLEMPDLSLDQPKGDPKAPPKAPPKEPTSDTPPAEPTLGLINPPMFSQADVSARTAMLVSANVAWDSAQDPPKEEKRKLITAIFDNLGKLGDSLAVVGIGQVDAETSQPIRDLLAVIAGDASKTVYIGTLGGRRLAESQADGIALYGTVVGHEARGKWFVTRMKLRVAGEPVVAMVSSSDLAPTLPANTNVLVVGRLLPDAVAELSAFEGEPGPAVLYGLHAVGN